MVKYINSEVVSSSAQSLYALRTLRAHGLGEQLLFNVFRATALSKLLYCSPAWWGFLSSSDKDRLEAFLRRAAKFGFYQLQAPSFSALCEAADIKLFHAVVNNKHHVLHALLPPESTHRYNLRQRPHRFTLPDKRPPLSDCNFITRMLYTQLVCTS